MDFLLPLPLYQPTAPVQQHIAFARKSVKVHHTPYGAVLLQAKTRSCIFTRRMTLTRGHVTYTDGSSQFSIIRVSFCIDGVICVLAGFQLVSVVTNFLEDMYYLRDRKHITLNCDVFFTTRLARYNDAAATRCSDAS